MSAEHTTVEPARADPARPELVDPARLGPDRTRLAAARTLLFVPGHRPDRFEKAAAAGADAVIIDLEDAVAPDGKDAARRHAADWLARGRDAVVRINAPGTPWWDADLDLVTAFGCPVMLPKAEDPDVIARIAEVCAVIPLVETAAGIERALDVCCAPGVVRAAFGSVDLATELGVRHDDTLALAYARSRLVMASAAAGVAPRWTASPPRSTTPKRSHRTSGTPDGSASEANCASIRGNSSRWPRGSRLRTRSWPGPGRCSPRATRCRPSTV
ncbi:HpcH/HpaI aldolase/citrate lyase family protein [Streptomyces aureus]